MDVRNLINRYLVVPNHFVRELEDDFIFFNLIGTHIFLSREAEGLAR